MAKLFSFCILFFFSINIIEVQAQNIRIEAPPGYNIIYLENNLPKNIEGSPFLDDWQSAEIYLKNGEVIADIMLRYNVFSDQMLFQKDNNTYVIGVPDSISEIKFPNSVFVYKNYIKGKKTEKGFFEILYSGKVGLLNRYKTEIIPSNYNVALGLGNKNDRLDIEEQLYLQRGEEIILLKKESKLMEVMQDKYKQVADYMDQERLSFKKKQDMIRILTFYDQLN